MSRACRPASAGNDRPRACQLFARRDVEPVNHLAEDLHSDVLFVEDDGELPRAQPEASQRFRRRHGRGTGTPIDQRRAQERDLPEVVPRAERPPLPSSPANLSVTLEDHEELLAELPLLAEVRSRLEGTLKPQVRDATELARRTVLEQRDGLQAGDRVR